jgi:hypothetical protein
MSPLPAMAIAVTISSAISTIVFLGLMQPLRALLRRACPGTEGEDFWMRFTVLMLYLCPLLIALVFGLPIPDALAKFDAGQIAQKVLSAALFGAVAALAVIGLRLSTLRALRG